MMNSLEREVGFTLLERGRGGVPTDEGRRARSTAIREFLQANARLDSTIAQVGVLAQRGHPRERIRQHGYALAAEHHPTLSRGAARR